MLLHTQGCYYNSLILQALELLPRQAEPKIASVDQTMITVHYACIRQWNDWLCWVNLESVVLIQVKITRDRQKIFKLNWCQKTNWWIKYFRNKRVSTIYMHSCMTSWQRVCYLINIWHNFPEFLLWGFLSIILHIFKRNWNLFHILPILFIDAHVFNPRMLSYIGGHKFSHSLLFACTRFALVYVIGI